MCLDEHVAIPYTGSKPRKQHYTFALERHFAIMRRNKKQERYYLREGFLVRSYSIAQLCQIFADHDIFYRFNPTYAKLEQLLADHQEQMRAAVGFQDENRRAPTREKAQQAAVIGADLSRMTLAADSSSERVKRKQATLITSNDMSATSAISPTNLGHAPLWQAGSSALRRPDLGIDTRAHSLPSDRLFRGSKVVFGPQVINKTPIVPGPPRSQASTSTVDTETKSSEASRRVGDAVYALSTTYAAAMEKIQERDLPAAIEVIRDMVEELIDDLSPVMRVVIKDCCDLSDRIAPEDRRYQRKVGKTVQILGGRADELQRM